MMNLAAGLLILVYISICAIVVGGWAFKTIEKDNDIEGLK